MPDPVDLDLGELTRQPPGAGVGHRRADRVARRAGGQQLDTRPAAPNGHRHCSARRCRARRRRTGDATGRPPRPAFGADRWDQRPRHRPARRARHRRLGTDARRQRPDRHAPGAHRDAVRPGSDGARHPHLPRSGPPRRARARVHRRRTAGGGVVLAATLGGARRRRRRRPGVADGGWTVPPRPRPVPGRDASSDEHRRRARWFAGVPRHATAGDLVDESGRSDGPPGALGGRRLPGRRGGLQGVVGTAGARPARRRTDARPRRSAAGTTGRLQAAARSRTPCAGRSTSTPHATPAWR